MSILVLGAGELGLSVIRSLTKYVDNTSTSLTVLLRQSAITSNETAKQRDIHLIRALNVKILICDIVAASADDLAALFVPFNTIISCTGFVGGSGTQLKIARAVLNAKVPRYVPWQFGVDYDVIGKGSAQDLFDEQLDVRAVLRGQTTTEWMIISTGMFTSFLFESFFGVVDLKENTVRALGSWDNAVTVTTAEDIGALTAHAIFAQPRIVNKLIYTAGDTITYNQLADLVDSILDRRVKRVEWTVPQLTAELAHDPTNAIKKYRVVFAQGRGVSWEKTNTFNAQHHIDTTDVEQWMLKNLKSPPTLLTS